MDTEGTAGSPCTVCCLERSGLGSSSSSPPARSPPAKTTARSTRHGAIHHARLSKPTYPIDTARRDGGMGHKGTSQGLPTARERCFQQRCSPPAALECCN